MQLAPEQDAAVERFVDEVYCGRRRQLTLGGYAGTGKTTIIREIVKRCPDVVVCTPTGKAAHVLRAKGVEEACTLHSLIYKPRVTAKGLTFDSRYLEDKFFAVIVDEASMLSRKMVNDIKRKSHAVMFVGDHGQLEPIHDDPGIMKRLDIELSQIHRQESGSAIIDFAHHVREGNAARNFGTDARVQRGGTNDLAGFDVILCGFNTMRVKVNAWVRKRRGYRGALPGVGERVICLQNNSDYRVWNGMLGEVVAIDEHTRYMDVDTDDGLRERIPFDPDQFGRPKTKLLDRGPKGKPPPITLWDFGYCLTVHKSQGSEWDRVAVYEQTIPEWDPARWRYTAATRAAKELRWII